MTIPSLLSYEIKDELGVTTSFPSFVDVPTATTVAQLQTFANDYTAVLDPVTDGEIVGITIKIPLVITGAKSSPVAGAEDERTALFNYEQAGSNRSWSIDVPAIAAAAIVSGKVDLTNAAIIAYRAFVLATTLGITFASAYGNALVAARSVLISFRKHRKSENRRSFEVG
jgi:hypothetical protein